MIQAGLKYSHIDFPENSTEGQKFWIDGRPKHNYQMAFQFNDGVWWRNYVQDKENK